MLEDACAPLTVENLPFPEVSPPLIREALLLTDTIWKSEAPLEQRIENCLRQASDWYLWGPYVSERQWGTVREDYSADGEAWDYLPHDHAR